MLKFMLLTIPNETSRLQHRRRSYGTIAASAVLFGVCACAAVESTFANDEPNIDEPVASEEGTILEPLDSSGFGFVSLAVTATHRQPPLTGNGYAVSNGFGMNGSETRIYRHGHHFASILTDNAIFAIRPHPGVDVNGWGGTIYLQPFIANATLGHSAVPQVVAVSTGVQVSVTGYVSHGSNQTYGTWTLTNMVLTYDPATKNMQGLGEYSIFLHGSIADAGFDLNIYKLANNYLSGVPLLDGRTNDTGDMVDATYVSVSGTTNQWNPANNPSHFPGPATDDLQITANGCFNEVDTLAQSWTNFRSIQAAYKPTIGVRLLAHASGYGTIPGFSYTTSEATNYYADNVGITPVVPTNSLSTTFQYTVNLSASALVADGTGVDATLAAVNAAGTNWSSIEVYYSETPEDQRINRLVGFLYPSGFTTYAGSVSVPCRPGGSTSKGFFRLVGPYQQRFQITLK